MCALIEKKLLSDKIEAALTVAMEFYSDYLNKLTLKNESTLQNRQLEALTSSLEEIVTDRTQHLTISNTELTEKLSRERQIIRFIKDIAAQVSVEDLLQVLRKEFKKFHKTGEPILIYETQNAQVDVSTFSGGRMVLMRTSSDLFKHSDAQANHVDFLVHLATVLGRPLAKTLVFKLELRLSNSELTTCRALFCIEHSLAGSDADSFLDFLNERIKPLEMALDRILLESHLEKYSFRWARTFDGVRDPIAIIDEEYNVVMANRKFGKSADRKKCYQIFAGQENPCEGCLLQGTLSGRKYSQGNLQVDNKMYRLFSHPVNAEESYISKVVVHQYVDITEERNLYLNYIQNEKMSAIGALAGNIAHELNNPLSGIRSLSQVLLSEVTESEDQLKADLQEIEKAAKRSQLIIANLLDFASGVDSQNEEVVLDDVIEKTLPMLKTAMRMHRLHLDLNTRQKRISVQPHLLQQVIFNLINNACQAMSDIGDLRVSTRADRDRVTFVVEDSGPGISPEIMSKIFTPFFTTKSEGQGTGLGLSLVKSIIEKFGGVIEVRNRQPKGAQFIVTLPARGVSHESSHS